MSTIPAFSFGGITRPELFLDPSGNIVLDPAAQAFLDTYGTKALYAGCPPGTPFPPISLLLSTPVDTNGAPGGNVTEGAAANTPVGITASAHDIIGLPITYSLTGDTSGGGFQIDPHTGVVTVLHGNLIDYETASGHAYSITVQASDGILHSSQTFTIGVNDVAPSTPTDGNAAANTVAEGAAAGTAVGITATSTDVNGPGVHWSLSADSSGGGFAINATTGVITVANPAKIDYETAPGHAYSVTAVASDGTLSSSQNFTIAVSDVAPSAPVDSDGAANTVAEGAANGSAVGVTASSTDPNGPAVTWALIGDTSGGGFTINATTGVVTVADSTKIDYESAPGHAYTVTAQSSDGTLTSSHAFVINVTDAAPSAPVDSNAAANTIAEGAANGSTVGVTASSTDVNGPAVTYSLTGDTSGGGFTINATTGVVTVADNTKIDFESAAGHAYTVTAQASDGTLSSSQAITIAVSDVAPSVPVDSNAAANLVTEGAANGSTVGVTASSTDVNGPAVTYSLVGDTSGGGFTINAATGVVTVADTTKIDYESAPGHAYTVTAQASDGLLTNSQTFTIAVADAPIGAPVDSNAAANTVAEGAANGSTVGITASAIDPNGPATTYALIGDTSGGGFTINATTGVVTVADSTKLDFKSAPGHAYGVTVQATNGATVTSSAFTIGVTDVAPSTPVDSNAAANTIAEGAANGSTVGVTASSTDVNGPAVSYSLIGDTSGGGFTINAATGVVTVADSTKIDFESAGGHAYTVTAQASDGTLSSSQTFTIAVSDVAPSTPVDTNAAANLVAEGAANGSTVGVTASSTDVNGPAVTYSLVGDTSGGGFTINAATGVVTVADTSKIDYASAPGHAYTVTAQASDGLLTSSQTFTIGVADAAPSTPVDSDAASNTIAEGAANGSTVGVTPTSFDVNGPPVTWSLIGDTSGGGFTINAATGVITVADNTKIDFETSGGSYTVVAQSSDGTLTSSQAFVIGVTDVAPSTPVDSDATANSVVQNAAVGATVGVTASSTDVNGPAVTYSLVGDTSGGGFTINAATGVVTVADSSKVIFLGNPTTYNVTVDSSDGTLHSQQTFSINVDPNASPIIDSDGGGATAAVSAAENQTAVTTVHATDPDNSPVTPVAYSIVGGDDQLKFAIDSTTGVLTFITAPDFENPTDTATAGNNTYIVVVQASDGAAVDQQTVTVTVTNVNDAPAITSNGGGATASINVNENTTAVTTVTATDQDVPAQTLTYSLAGGADQGKFSINSSTGILTFNSAPNFEAPTDTGGDNGYDVIVRVTDNGAPNLHDDQAITVHVQNVNEAPDTAAVTVTGNEDPTGPAYIPITITGTDVDAGDFVASFHITNVPNTGTQGTLYSDIGLTTQVTNGADVAASGNAATLYFVPNANFNTHAGAVTFNAAATDTHSLTDATPATETINVTAVNDAPVNNSVPSSFTVQSGFNHVITGLSISDVDANEVGTPTDITTTFTAGAGTVSIGNGTSGGTAGIAGGATITTNATGTVVLTGSIAQINTTLSGNNVAYNAADSAANTSSSTTLQMATNDHGHNGTGGALTDTDTINVGVIPQVWFINGDQTGVDSNAPRGSQTNPFSTITEFNASSGPGTNDYIYLKAGTYTGDGINLKAGQILLGDDQALSFADPLGGPPIVIETASGARPTINVTTAGDQGIALASGNTVTGVIVTTNASTQVGIDDSGASVGTLNISDTDVTGGGQAINLTHGGTGGSVTLGTVSSTGGTTGIALGGALVTNFSATTGTLSGHSSSEITISGGSGTVSIGSTIGDGTGLSASITNRTAGTVTLSGNINDSNDTGGGVGVSNNTGGTINFTGATKTLNTGIGDGVSMTNNSGTTVNFTNGGLDIDTTNGTGFSATVAGTYSVTGTGNTITTVTGNGTGTGLNLANVTVGAGGVTFDSVSTTGSATGISVNTVTGGAINVNGGAIAGATSNGVVITAAQDNIAIASSIASSAAGHSVQVTNSGAAGGNTIAFSGAITDPGLGVNLDNNDQNGGVATVNFSGGLNIHSTTHTGFNAINGGVVNVTNGANNSVTTTTGTAVNIVNTTIGTSGVTFHDVSSNGAPSGIVLNNTGSGSFTVTGDGGASSNHSGGTINASTGVGVSLTNTGPVSLNYLDITNSGTDGVNAIGVNGFTLTRSNVTDTSGGAADEGLQLANMTGTIALTNDLVSGSPHNNLFLQNNNTNLTALNITNSTFQNTLAGTGADGALIETQGTSVVGAITIKGSTFSGNGSTGLQVQTEDTSNIQNLTVGLAGAGNGNTFSGNNAGTDFDVSQNSDLTFSLVNNSFQNNVSQAINVFTATASGPSASVTGKIQDNTVGTQGVLDSGSANGSGIRVIVKGGTHGEFTIDGNQIHEVANARGIDLEGFHTASGGGGADFNVINNHVFQPTGTNQDLGGGPGQPLPLAAIWISSDNETGASGDELVRAVVSGNTVYDPTIWQPAFGGEAAIYLQGNNFGGINAHLQIEGTGSVISTVAGNNTISNDNDANPTNNIILDGNVALIAPGSSGPFPLLAGAGGVQASTPTPGDMNLTQVELDTVVAAAIAQWAHAGASASQLAALQATVFSVGDLSGNTVGEQAPGNPSHIVIDVNAAGHGWFVDPTPSDNSEFTHAVNGAGTDLVTDPSNAAAGHLDLLTTVTHELGHVLGLADKTDANDVNDLMYINLVDGERRVVTSSDVVEASTNPATSMTPAVSIGPAGTPIGAGHDGGALVGTPAADNFVFANLDSNAPVPHVVGYNLIQGDTFDFSALTANAHAWGFGDAMIVRAVEDAGGHFATLQVNTSPESTITGAGGGAYGGNWVDVAQIDGAHAGDGVNVLIDSHAAVHLAQIHVGLLV